jgi:glycerate kinase
VKIICSPDSFKGSISAVDAASAMADGIFAAIPDANIDCCPVGDGGEGTLAALLESVDGWTFTCRVHGVLGGGVDVPVGQFPSGNFAYIETATVVGPDSSPDGARDVMAASTFGIGELIERACINSPARVLIGLGGSATNDGGCGMAQALGVRFFDASDKWLEAPLGGADLQRIYRVDVSQRSNVIRDVPVVALCDVNNVLTGPDGAAKTYGPQKGATPGDVARLDEGLANLAGVIKRDLGIDVESMAGAGAAGGLGAGLVAFADATIESGIDTVLAAIDFGKRLNDTDLCLTGEGRMDDQSLFGKACMGVAGKAREANVPAVALVGSTGPGAEDCLPVGLTEIVVIGAGLPARESISNVAELLANAAAAAAVKYKRDLPGS